MAGHQVWRFGESGDFGSAAPIAASYRSANRRGILNGSDSASSLRSRSVTPQAAPIPLVGSQSV
jgi:hypothetical protein